MSALAFLSRAGTASAVLPAAGNRKTPEDRLLQEAAEDTSPVVSGRCGGPLFAASVDQHGQGEESAPASRLSKKPRKRRSVCSGEGNNKKRRHQAEKAGASKEEPPLHKKKKTATGKAGRSASKGVSEDVAESAAVDGASGRSKRRAGSTVGSHKGKATANRTGHGYKAEGGTSTAEAGEPGGDVAEEAAATFAPAEAESATGATKAAGAARATGEALVFVNSAPPASGLWGAASAPASLKSSVGRRRFVVVSVDLGTRNLGLCKLEAFFGDGSQLERVRVLYFDRVDVVGAANRRCSAALMAGCLLRRRAVLFDDDWPDVVVVEQQLNRGLSNMEHVILGVCHVLAAPRPATKVVSMSSRWKLDAFFATKVQLNSRHQRKSFATALCRFLLFYSGLAAPVLDAASCDTRVSLLGVKADDLADACLQGVVALCVMCAEGAKKPWAGCCSKLLEGSQSAVTIIRLLAYRAAVVAAYKKSERLVSLAAAVSEDPLATRFRAVIDKVLSRSDATKQAKKGDPSRGRGPRKMDVAYREAAQLVAACGCLSRPEALAAFSGAVLSVL